MGSKIRVTVWNEYGKEQEGKEVSDVYPNGMHEAIAAFLNKDPEISAKTSTMRDSEQGLSEALLAETDVMLWWGHIHHNEVEEKYVQRVIDSVHSGMGIIFLHSAHQSRPFLRLLGTSGRLSWREANERERLWTATPGHPIAQGVPEQFVIEHDEMYSEPFGIPEPLSTVFIGWFQGGNVLRSGVTFMRNNGRIFYFQPGHETFPVYHNVHVQRILTNAVKWSHPVGPRIDAKNCPNDKEPLEPLTGN
ncbi:trehalose utilization protein ThuA [Spirochaetia bacterium]|nr:trehalose utilization protein ThuA [Spirochaetia bacterium]